MKNKKKFKLFDMNRDGKGVDKVAEGPKNFKNFFKFYGRKFTKLLSLNLIMMFMALPIIIGAMLYFTGPTVRASSNMMFPVLYGVSFSGNSPAVNLALAINSIQLSVPAYNSYIYYVISGLALFLVITFGWQNVGSTYILRNMVTGDPVFIISDYMYAIKKNLRQGFIMGLIDCAAMFMLFVDFMYFRQLSGSFMLDMMYAVTVALIILYTIMRFYIYLQIVTFNLSLWKIIKNAFIFTALGIKRNIVALLGLVIIIAVNVALIIWLLPFNLILPLLLPLFYYMATAGFIKTYAAYPIIDKYMIQPNLHDIEEQEKSENADNTGDTDDTDNNDGAENTDIKNICGNEDRISGK